MFFFLLVSSIVLVPSKSFPQSEKTYGLAVLDLQANGIAVTEALALSDVLRSSILKVIQEQRSKVEGFYTLIERSQMDKIFEEFEVQNTGCTDVSCAIEFGKMLSAERIIVGSVGLVGSTYIVVARIVDVETSTTLVSVDRTVPSPVDNVIKLMSAVGHELLTGERLAVSIDQTLAVSPQIPPSQPDPEREIAGISMISIPAGSFRMGDISGDGSSNERPVRDVTISSFDMGKYEVTQGQYQTVMGSNPAKNCGVGDSFPVYLASWYNAVTFCNKLSDEAGFDRSYDESTWECDFSKNGYRLPTEAEWEYACRAGTETKYYTGNSESDLGNAGWYKDNRGSKTTHIVGQKTANAFGLYDMHGNVYEFCSDRYDKNYYSSSPSDNPIGPTSGRRRVIRGGSWNYDAGDCRSASRTGGFPSFGGTIIGFRVVRRP